MITDRKIAVLKAVAKYRVLGFRQIQTRIYPADKDGRITRRDLTSLLADKLINRTHMQVFNPSRGTAAAAYYPAKAGCELLAIREDDVRYLAVNTTCPQWQNLGHWQELASVAMIIADSIALQTVVTMPLWFNEFDVVSKDAADPAERHSLYTLIRKEPKLVCVPDAAFQLTASIACKSASKAYYIELECGTNSPQKAAAEKTPGYAGLAAGKLHRRHFPDATDNFNVLMFAPTPNWRDALRKAISKKERPDLWRICSMTDMKPETFLTEPIFYPAGDGPPMSLLKGSGGSGPAAVQRPDVGQ